MRKTFKKIFIWFISIIAGMALLLYLLLSLPPVQNRLAGEVIGVVNRNLDLSLSLDRIRIVFFNRARVHGATLRSAEGDSIIHVSTIAVTLKASELLRRNLHVRRLRLEGPSIHLVKHREDSTLNIAKVFASIPQREPPGRQEEGLDFHIRRISLTDTDFSYADEVSGSRLSIHMAGLNLVLDSIAPDGPVILADKLEIEELGMESLQPGEEGFFVSGLHADIDDIEYRTSHYAASIISLKGQINDLPEILDLTGQATLSGQSASLEEFRLETEAGRVQLTAAADYPSMDHFISNPASGDFTLEFTGNASSEQLSVIAGNSLPLKKMPSVDLTGNISGNLARLSLKSLMVKAGSTEPAESALALGIQGEVLNLGEAGEMTGQLILDSLVLDRDRMKEYLADTLVPSTLEFPRYMTLRGRWDGSPSDWESDLRMESPYGDLQSGLMLTVDTSGGREDFTVRLSTGGFDAGALLGMHDTLGNVAFRAAVEGTSRQFSDPTAEVQLDVQSLQYMNQTYDSLFLTAGYDGSGATAQLSLLEEHIRFHLDAVLRDLDSVPETRVVLEVQRANLAALGLSDQPSGLDLSLILETRGGSREELAGNLHIDGLNYYSGDSEYSADSLFLQLENQRAASAYTLEILGVAVGDSMNFSLFNEGVMNLSEDSITNRSSLRIQSPQLADSMQYDITIAVGLAGEGWQSADLRMGGSGVLMEGRASMEKRADSSYLDARASIESFDLEVLYPFLANQFNTLSGTVTGEAEITGPVDDPDLAGNITLQQVRVNPAILNTLFTFENEMVSLKKDVLLFDQVTLTDVRDNQAVLNGTIQFGKEPSGGLDLSFRAENFQLLDKPATTEDLFYGSVRIDLDATVSGEISSPQIEMLADFNHPSEFTFIVPGGAPPSGRGLVEFVDSSDTVEAPARDTVAEEIITEEGGVAFTANLGVTDALTLHVVTNPFTGESLDITGSGNLGFNMGQGGQMSLTGTYEIRDGSYELILFEVIRREFTLESGSSLTWTGPLMEAEADLTAVYSLNTSAEGLVRSGMAVGDDDNNQNLGRIPVDVVMHLTGPLLTPGVEFDLRTEPQYQATAVGAALSRLSQSESELNKQVFSLLLLNQFTSDIGGSNDPMSYKVRNAARQSLGNLLTQQLNQFATRHLEGVDLSLQIESYEQRGATGAAARTEVDLDVSRSLLNERLTIQVGGNVAVEEPGGSGGQLEAGDLSGDFSVEYKLTPDGTYRLKAFNRTDYEDEIDGEVTKTGASFIFGKDFDHFRWLFGRNREDEKGQDTEQDENEKEGGE